MRKEVFWKNIKQAPLWNNTKNNQQRVWKNMYKTLENHVDNLQLINRYKTKHHAIVDIHKVIKTFLRSFPPIYNEKRYKLINFATIVRHCG